MEGGGGREKKWKRGTGGASPLGRARGHWWGREMVGEGVRWIGRLIPSISVFEYRKEKHQRYKILISS